MDLVTYYAVEDKVLDGIDYASRGLVRLKSGYVFVTSQSEATTAGALQRAIDLASDYDTIEVQAGTYTGSTAVPVDGVVATVLIDKPLTLIGPNASYDPLTSVTPVNAQAIIVPGTSDPTLDSNESVGIYITSSEVSVTGFTVDGDNPTLTSGLVYGGADIDAAEGIASYTGVGNITVAHNVVRNVSYAGIDFYNADNTAATSDNLISSNYVDNLSGISGVYGIGVILYNNFYAQVTNNVLDHLRVGVQTGNFSQANSDLGFAPSISGNHIASIRDGIFYNLMYGPSTTFAVQGNTLTAVADASNTSGWEGALISSIQSAVDVNFSGNTIDGSGADVATPTTGLEVWNTPSTGSMVLSGDTISGVDYGVWVNTLRGLCLARRYHLGHAYQ